MYEKMMNISKLRMQIIVKSAEFLDTAFRFGDLRNNASIGTYTTFIYISSTVMESH